MAAGYTHSIVLGHGGEVVSTFGAGGDGRLGHGGEEDEMAPRVVGALEGVKVAGIAGGAFHTIVCTTAGIVYTFGYGENGRLGHGGEGNEYLPRVVQGLEGQKVVCAAGAEHTVVRTDEIRVRCTSSRSAGAFTFGLVHDMRCLRLHVALNSLSADFTAASFALLAEGAEKAALEKAAVREHVSLGDGP